jgi:hypothetical protein
MNPRIEVRRITSASIQSLSGAAIGESVVIVAMMMAFPSTVATVVMPPALVVIPFIAVTVAVDRSGRVDHRRGSLVYDWGWRDIDGPGHPQINSDVSVGESRAGCARSGKSHCQKKGRVFHGVLLSCSFLAATKQW